MAYMPKKIFEQPIEYSKCSIFPDMPYFLNDLGLFKAKPSWSNAFIVVSNNNHIPIKQLKVLNKYIDENIAVFSDFLDSWYKNSLADAGYGFCDKNSVYLPFAGVSDKKIYKSKSPKKLSPNAQRLFINIFYDKWKGVRAKDISTFMNVSKSSITKYVNEIESICPGIVKVNGREKYLERSMAREDLFNVFIDYLISPVKKTLKVNCSLDFIPHDNYCRISGISALGNHTDLSTNSSDIVIAFKSGHLNDFLIKNPYYEVPLWSDKGITVEEWKYWDDFPNEDFHNIYNMDCVNDFSLLLSLEEYDDVRVQDAKSQLKRKICQ